MSGVSKEDNVKYAHGGNSFELNKHTPVQYILDTIV